jgi:hypothetical protein
VIRRRSSRAPAIAWAGALAVLVAGCGNPLPGTLLGTYQVNATAQANGCGLAAPARYQFYVELSEATMGTTTTLYWSWLTDMPIASGALAPVSAGDARLQASLSASQSANVDGTDAGPGPCTMDRADSLVVTLATGTPPPSFTGTMSYAFSAASGADCTDQLAASGGAYAALPCTVGYALAASRR